MHTVTLLSWSFSIEPSFKVSGALRAGRSPLGTITASHSPRLPHRKSQAQVQEFSSSHCGLQGDKQLLKVVSSPFLSVCKQGRHSACVWAIAGGIATLPWRVMAHLQCPSQLFGKSHTPNGGIAAGQLTGVCVCVVLPEPLQFHCIGVASSFSVNACLCSKFSLDIRWAEPHRNSHYTLCVPRAAAQSRRGRERPGRTGRAGLPSPALQAAWLSLGGTRLISCHISCLLEAASGVSAPPTWETFGVL